MVFRMILHFLLLGNSAIGENAPPAFSKDLPSDTTTRRFDYENSTLSSDFDNFVAVTERSSTKDYEKSTFSTESETFGSTAGRSLTTNSEEKTTIAEQRREPEFVTELKLDSSTRADLYCKEYGSNYRALFFYNNTEDLLHVQKILNSSHDGVEFWTDLHTLNRTTFISNVTGKLFPNDFIELKQSEFNEECVTIEAESGRIFQKAKGCHLLNHIMCRIYTPKTDGGDASSQGCNCNCNNGGTRPTLTEDDMEIVVSEIRKNLTVVKANLSSSIRKRISASDPRMSSRVIGMTLGVSILSFVASLLVIPDLVAGFRCLVSRLCGRS